MIIEAILKRRSVREFRTDPVTEDEIGEIIAAAQYAPTAMNRKPVEFVVIRDEAVRAKLFDILAKSLRQDSLRTAPVVIVPLADTQKSVLPHFDLAIASEHLMLQAAELGLGTVWKNIAPEIVPEILALLGVPPHFTLANVIPVGHPKDAPAAHTPAELEAARIHPEKW